MTILTVPVTARINGQDGAPIAGATVSAKLQGITVYQGHVLPELTEATTDAQGVAVLNLWPNALSPTPSLYRFKIQSDKAYTFYAAVPNQEVFLDQLVQVDPSSVDLSGTGTDPGSGTPGTPGAPGLAATIRVGNVNTLAPNTPATVVNTGTVSAAVLDFGLPQGAKGDKGDPGLNGSGTMVVGSVSTLPPGSTATVTNVGTPEQAILNFGIPQGLPGSSTGSGGVVSRLFGKYLWEGGSSNPPGGGVDPGLSIMDATLLADYRNAMSGVSLGSKRVAGANAVITDMGTAQRLTLICNGSTVLTADYTGPMVLINDGYNVSLGFSTLSTVSAIAAADRATGTWSMELTGGAGYARKITLAVSADANTAPGMGFNPTPNPALIVPRSLDGLA